jgi:AbrB family looped-hinge helix DNA binding protein
MDKKGKITIPAKIRKEEHYKEGMSFTFIRTADGLVLVPLLSKEELLNGSIDHKLLQKIIDQHDQEELELEK